MASYDEKKEIAGRLDTLAARAEMAGRSGATSRQCWYLASLLADRGLDESIVADPLNTSAMLSKRRASALIDELLKGTFGAAA